MLIALGDIYAQIPSRERVRELMLSTQARVRGADGCIDYAFAETLEDPGHFVVVQQWRDQAALDAHYRSDAFAEYQREIDAHLVRESELRVYSVQAAAQPVNSAAIDTSADD
jgi:quinol monooxygenase YgiN